VFVENVKKLKVVEISPEGNVVKISGQNEAGKSSVLDSIFYALSWKDARKEVDRPVRDGEKEAQVQLVLKKDDDDNFILADDVNITEEDNVQEIVVTRKWTSNSQSYLKIETVDGSKFASPQSLLDTLINDLSFDPFTFMRLDSKAQIDQMFRLADSDVDPRALDKKRANVYQERTFVNREIKKLEGQLAEFDEEKPNSSYPTKEITADSVLEKLRKAREVKTENDKLRTRLSDIAKEFNRNKDDIRELEEQVKEIRERINLKVEQCKKLSSEGKELKKQISELKDPDIEKIENQLQQVEEHNKKFAMKKRYDELKHELSVLRDESKSKTDEIKNVDKEKEEIIKNLKFPIKGLSFDEEGVIYNGVPLKQCAKSQQLKVSLAIGMATKPKLKFIRILDGALLTKNNQEIIEQMAKEEDYQVWMEVASDKPVGIFIEDGRIKSQKHED
jgi:chromosome segregation ATPase